MAVRDLLGGAVPASRGGNSAIEFREAHALILAAAVWIGAVIARPVPVPVVVAVLVGAALLARPWWLILAGGLLALALSARADSAYRMVDAGPYRGDVTLLDDPVSGLFGMSIEGRIDDGRRVVVSLPPDLASRARAWAAGDVVSARGQLSPLTSADPGSPYLAWARSRHLTGRLAVETASHHRDARWWWWPSEHLRAQLRRSGRLVGAHAPLYTGLVIGDDNDQPLDQQARFRHAGLSHLQAVSGQNVLLVLLVVGPMVRRAPRWLRLVLLSFVLAAFTVATRAEPSVLRAVATAAIALVAAARGRRATGVHILSLAVAGIVLVDPFLVDAVGFRLSVAASGAILVLGPAMIRRIPGPRWWAEAVGVTVAAQIGVLPLLVATFGPVSVVSLPANVAAGGAAGLVMAWGMSGGLVAAGLPPWLGRLVQWPAARLVAWIDGVASWAARVEAPQLNGRSAAVAVPAVLGAWWAIGGLRRKVGVARIVGVATALTIVATVSPVGRLIFGRSNDHHPTPRPLAGAVFWPGDGDEYVSALVVTRSAGPQLVEELVTAGIDGLDFLVVEASPASQRRVIAALSSLTHPAVVLAPDRHRIHGARRLTRPIAVPVAPGTTLHIAAIEDRLVVRASAQ